MTGAPAGSARWPSFQRVVTIGAPLVTLIRWLPIAMLLVAAALGALSLVAPTTVRAGWWTVVPEDPAGADPFVVMASAAAIAAVAFGLIRGKRDAFLLAVASLGLALVAQAWAPAPARAIVEAGCLGILLLDRSTYRVRSTPGSARLLLALVGVAAALASASVIAPLLAGARPGAVAVEAVLAMRSIASAFSFSGAPPPVALAGFGVAVVILAGLARLVLAVGAIGLLRPEPAELTPLSPRARRIVVEHGHGSLMPFQLAEGVGGCETPGLEAVVVFAVQGRWAIALGEPVGRPEHLAPAWSAFVDSCSRRDLLPAIYQATERGHELDRRTGRSIMVGLEPIIALPGFSMTGSSRANLRHTVTRARRGGIRTVWWPDGIPEVDLPVRAGLADVDAAWRASIAGPTLGFTVGAFDPLALGHTATSVALDATGRPIAFATFRPAGHGGWVLELMRRRPGSVPGAFESCVVEAAERLASSGAIELSLGLVPLAGLDPRSGRLPERLLALAARGARPVYDIRGLESFKRKFDPSWEPRYLVVSRSIDVLGAGLALVRLHLAGRGIAGALATLVRRPSPLHPEPFHSGATHP